MFISYFLSQIWTESKQAFFPAYLPFDTVPFSSMTATALGLHTRAIDRAETRKGQEIWRRIDNERKRECVLKNTAISPSPLYSKLPGDGENEI